jgi:hypothetical protein
LARKLITKKQHQIVIGEIKSTRDDNTTPDSKAQIEEFESRFRMEWTDGIGGLIEINAQINIDQTL